MSLFPSSRGQAASGAAAPSVISFKAGLMVIGNETDGRFNCSADNRKGLISLVKDQADNLLHFRWSTRPQGTVEIDRMIFPDEVDFKKVNTGRPEDRVYLLKYRGGGPKLMFWLQDQSTEKDADNISKLNNYLNDPAAADAAHNAAVAAHRASSTTAAGGASAGAGAGGTLGSSDLRAALSGMAAGGAGGAGAGGMSPEQWMKFMGLQGQPSLPPAAPAPATTTSTASSSAAAAPAAAAAALDFSSLFGAIAPSTSAPAPAPAPAPVAPRQRPLRLQEIVSTANILSSGVLEDPQVRASLIEHLPESQRSDEFLETTIRSPQFIQALGALSSALQSDNFNNVMASMQLDPSTGMIHLMSGDAVRAFLAAVEAQAQNEQAGQGGGEGGGGGGEGGGNGGPEREDETGWGWSR